MLSVCLVLLSNKESMVNSHSEEGKIPLYRQLFKEVQRVGSDIDEQVLENLHYIDHVSGCIKFIQGIYYSSY